MKDTFESESNYVQFIPKDEEPQVAYLFSIIGFGHQQKKKYQSEEMEWKNQIIFFFELCYDRHVFPDGVEKPLIVNFQTNRTLDERSKLYKMIKGFRGGKFMKESEAEGIEWDKFLGNICLLTLENTEPNSKGKVYTNVITMNRVMKGVKTPKSLDEIFNQNKLIFDITSTKPDWEQFVQLWPWVQKIIMKSREWNVLLTAKAIPQFVFDALAEDNKLAKEEAKVGTSTSAHESLPKSDMVYDEFGNELENDNTSAEKEIDVDFGSNLDDPF